MPRFPQFCRWLRPGFIALIAALGLLAQSARAEEGQPAPQNEEEWLVRGVCQNLGQLLAFASAKTSGANITDTPPQITVVQHGNDAGIRSYDLRVARADGKTFARNFSLSSALWDASSYRPWAQSMAAEWNVRTAPATAHPLTDDALVALLAEPTMGNFLKVNSVLSAALTQNPADPELHEQAALLLAAVAWSEAAGNFSDPRELLNRACAHLTMANLLRKDAPAGQAGHLANLTLLVLTGRQAEASQQLDTWSGAKDLPAPLHDWLVALQLANFGDWRNSKPTAKATLLWRRAYFRSVAENTTPDRAIPFYQSLNNPTEPDWARIALARDFSVGIGNSFIDQGLKGETAEIQQLAASLKPGILKDSMSTANFLNETSSGPWQNGGLMVIDEGLWTERAQRHLLNMIARSYFHLQVMLGVPDEAADLLKMVHSLTDNLRLAPFYHFYVASNQNEFDEAVNSAGKLVGAHPDWASAANWREIRSPTKSAWAQNWAYHGEVPEYQSWFDPWLPTGTTFDTGERMRLPEVQTLGADDIKTWMKMAPNKPSLKQTLAHAEYGDTPSAEALRTIFGPQVEYNEYMARAVANAFASQDDMTDYRPAMETVCKMDPNNYMSLGVELAEHGLNDEAAIAFQHGVDLADDSVQVSNNMEFLVNYYFEHGRVADAEKIAQMAADVYSGTGLRTQAELDLRLKKYADALKIAQQMQERYNETSMLVVVYAAWLQANPDAKTKAEGTPVVAAVFPKGFEKTNLGDLVKTGAPTDGVRLLTRNYYTEHNGVEAGDVIVAINGQRTHNLMQYKACFDMGNSLNFQIIYWRNGQYLEKQVWLPFRQFEVQAEDYKP